MYQKIDAYHSQQHTFGCHATETGDDFYLDTGTDEAEIHSINPALVKMGANSKHNISEIVIPAADEISARRTFFPTQGI